MRIFMGSGYAQESSSYIEELYTELRVAVCLNDWDDALFILDPMIASPLITEGYRDELMQFRQQVQGWQTTQAQFLNQPNCEPFIRQQTNVSPVTLQPPPDNAQSGGTMESPDATDPDPTDQSTTDQSTTDQSTTDQSTTDPNTTAIRMPLSNPSTALLSQCTELGDVVNWTDSQAASLLSRTDISDIDSLVGMLSGLAQVSEQAVSNLRSLRVTDGSLQTFQQEFIAIYEGFRQATQGFVAAANAGEFTTMEQSNTHIQTLATQELTLINQVNAYCGQEIIANN